VDQLLLLHQTGQLRPLPGQGVRVLFVGSWQGYLDETGEFHPEISAELVRRGCAVYA
jgi:hypothetical protein